MLNMIDQFIPIIPEISLSIIAMILLIAGLYQKEGDSSFIFKIAIFSLALVAWQVIEYDYNIVSAFNGMFILDGFAIFIKFFILIATIFVLLIAFSQSRKNLSFEFPVLIILATVGMMIMVSANDLMSLYMGLELQSLSLYILAAFNKNSSKSSEAGIKYFILGALASGILLYGASLIYGFTGTSNFTEIAAILAQGTASEGYSTGVLFGMILVFVALCFKISAVPFHMWAPDVYEGASKVVTAFFASAPKVAAIALFVRFSIQPMGELFDQWQQIIIFVSIASMIVGSFAALKQTNIKRMLAYSSIGHVGFILMGLAAGSVEAIQGVLVYLCLYIFMTVGIFAAVILMKKQGKSVEDIHDLAGLAYSRKLLAIAIAVLMFSMAGIPPMAGFFGKLLVFKAALAAELYSLAIIGVLASVVSAFYYLRIIKIMYFDKSEDIIDAETPLELKFVLTFTAIVNLLFFITPAPLFNAAKAAAQTLF